MRTNCRLSAKCGQHPKWAKCRCTLRFRPKQKKVVRKKKRFADTLRTLKRSVDGRLAHFVRSPQKKHTPFRTRTRTRTRPRALCAHPRIMCIFQRARTRTRRRTHTHAPRPRVCRYALHAYACGRTRTRIMHAGMGTRTRSLKYAHGRIRPYMRLFIYFLWTNNNNKGETPMYAGFTCPQSCPQVVRKTAFLSAKRRFCPQKWANLSTNKKKRNLAASFTVKIEHHENRHTPSRQKAGNPHRPTKCG